MLIGLDLDNTIIDYDAAFIRIGQRLDLLPKSFNGGKREVRRFLWDQPDGDLGWQILQAEVYGNSINEAAPSPGVAEFIAQCRHAGLQLAVVSHKTRFAAADPGGVDLRAAALGWLRRQGFCPVIGAMIAEECVYFTDTRAAKLHRIAALGCDYFVDDLEEVLRDPAFPPRTTGLHFAPALTKAEDRSGLRVCRSWNDVQNHIFAGLGRACA